MLGHVFHQERHEQWVDRAESDAEQQRRDHKRRLAVGDGQHRHTEHDHRQARHDDPRVADAIGIASDERPGTQDGEGQHREIHRTRRHADLLGVDGHEAGNAAVTERIEEQRHADDDDAPFDQVAEVELAPAGRGTRFVLGQPPRDDRHDQVQRRGIRRHINVQPP